MNPRGDLITRRRSRSAVSKQPDATADSIIRYVYDDGGCLIWMSSFGSITRFSPALATKSPRARVLRISADDWPLAEAPPSLERELAITARPELEGLSREASALTSMSPSLNRVLMLPRSKIARSANRTTAAATPMNSSVQVSIVRLYTTTLDGVRGNLGRRGHSLPRVWIARGLVRVPEADAVPARPHPISGRTPRPGRRSRLCWSGSLWCSTRRSRKRIWWPPLTRAKS